MKQILFLLATLPFFWGCSDDNDTQKPQVEIISPADGDHFHPGETISLNVVFEDNTELASYKIEIHYNSDGHNHKSASTNNVAFEYNKSYSFEKGLNSFELSYEIVIPTTINELPIKEGEYHLGIHCFDKAGNESEVFVEIEIEAEIDV